MAKNKNLSYNDIPDKNEDWGLDPRNGFKYSGESVQKFIKETFDSKMGYFHYDTSSNRYLVFADEASKNEYVENPTLTDLVLGSFDAPFNYEASITLLTPSYAPVLLGATGNYVSFKFDIRNKSGNSVGESVNATWTFIKGSTKQTLKAKYRYGQTVSLNVDKYLSEGTNNIIVSIVGENTLAATSVSVTYQVVNLQLSSGYDISRCYNLNTNPEAIAEIPFTVSGYGTKKVEWWVDGVQLDEDIAIDEVTQTSASRTKLLPVGNLSQGRHSLQVRAYTVVDGERFYSNVLYMDLTVYDGSDTNPIIALSAVLPNNSEVPASGLALSGVSEFVPFNIDFAVYNPLGAETEVVLSMDDVVVSRVNAQSETVNTFSYVPTSSGVKRIKFLAGVTEYWVSVDVDESDNSLEEITDSLELDLQAVGKTNASTDRNQWVYKNITTTFRGFAWNSQSGWVDNALVIGNGASIEVGIKPLLADATNTGKTMEFEFSTTGVSDDNAVVCDLRDASGTGILITASKVSLISSGGKVLSTPFKSEENIRVAFVINKDSGVTNKGLAFIYVNGIASGAVNFATTDNFISSSALRFAGSESASIILRSLRFYNTALSDNQVLNNYMLYRPSVSDMLEVYDRNNIFEEGTENFSMDKLANQLPVMIVTGDIPALEATTDKNKSIVVDVEYINYQNPELSFTMKNAHMQPQGTSSMGYPKKNFRLYTQKRDDTRVYDADGKEVASKLYSFRQGAAPVNCWCMKADYAESSSTHNTGIARLWNDALKNVKVDEEYVCRTEAQKKALENGYEYDVRTTIDGFPIIMAYRLTPTSDLVFIGKYNFNNDKETEQVFGFRDIPGFDNSKMQCWEVLNNGHHLALFQDTTNFDDEWEDAFEARYPDKSKDISDVKAFAEWLTTTTDFATEKWQHLDVYKMAAYYVYVMRFGAVDQMVKNAMFTSEDGQKFYYINYDNDTINGLRNDGYLVYSPTITRQTLDDSYTTEVYAYAGHDSLLWNSLEADTEFMQIVQTVDAALYNVGLTYANVIRMFDEQQSAKWCERVYNRDAQYKYVSPFVESGTNNLFMLQGSRQSHRRWWLSKRFAFIDSLFVSGEYKANIVEAKLANAPIGIEFGIKAGQNGNYGYGVNNVAISYGIALNKGEEHTFSTVQVLNIGDPLRIYAAPDLEEVNLSNFTPYLSTLNIAGIYNETLGTKLKSLVLGVESSTDQRRNSSLKEISSLASASKLEHLNIEGYEALTSLDLSGLKVLKSLKAYASGLTSVVLADGSPVEMLELPNSLKGISLSGASALVAGNLKIQGGWTNIATINIRNCPNISSEWPIVKNWFDNKSDADYACSLTMDKVNWTNVDAEDIIALGGIKTSGGVLYLKGIIRLNEVTLHQVEQIKAVYGEYIFVKGGELWITAPESVFIGGVKEIVEGDTLQLTSDILSEHYGSVEWSIKSGAGATISQHGLLTTTETGSSRDVVVNLKHIPAQGDVINASATIPVKKAVRPTSGNIEGNSTINADADYLLNVSPSGINKPYSVKWSLSGFAYENKFVSIKSSSNTSCSLSVDNPMGYGALVLTATITTDKGTTVTVTKNITVGTTLVVNISSNQGTDSTISAVKADVTFGSTTLKVGAGQTASVPVGTLVSVSFPSVQGYTQPSTYEYISTKESNSVSATYSTTVVKVTISDNQTSLNDISGVKATVKYDSVSTQLATGGSVKIPTGKSVTITWGAVSGYSTPATNTFTATGTSMQFEGVYKTAVLTLTVKTNQSSHTDVTSKSVTVKGTTVNTTLKSGGSVKVPFGEEVTLTAPAVNGYTTPAAVKYTAADASKEVTMTYNTTIVTVNMADNQTAYNDISSATATVAASGMTTATVSSGGTAKVPTGATCTITWSAVSGYKTPDKQTFTTSGTSVSKTGTYQTEILTVNVTSDIDLPASYTVTVSGIGLQTTASKVYKVPFGTSYTVNATAEDGYNKVENQTFTASQVSRTVSVVYYEKTIELPSITGATDLSRQDIHGASTSMNTANCYVVKTAGTYAFPLVYGNAFKNGAVNKSAYTKVAGDYSHNFVNHLDSVITSPFIEDHANCTAVSAELIMADTDSVFANLSLVEGGPCKYIQFKVNSVPSTGANGVISVLDRSGTVMWSWHIWVWPDDLTPVTITNNTGVDYNILPVNLATKKDASTSGKMYNWFYQWGRPTPMLPPNAYNSTINATNYGVRTFVVSSAKADTYGAGIQNPQTFYKSSSSPYNWFGSSLYYNLWDANCTSTGNSDNTVVKTVYDPCPVGFKMPNGNTFTYFSSTNVVGSFSTGWYFKRNSSDTIGVFFPASGFRSYSGGSLYGVGSYGYVWLSSAYSQYGAYSLGFSSSNVDPQDSRNRAYGSSVRPVQE